MECLGLGILYIILTPRVPWNVFDQVCSFGLEVSNFFYRNMHAVIIYRNRGQLYVTVLKSYIS